MNSAGIHPAIVEVEERAHSDGVINRFVVPAHRMQRFHVERCDIARATIHQVDEAKERLFFFRQPGCFEIAYHATDELFGVQIPVRCLFQQNSRDRGVGLQSKWTIVAGRGESSD